MDLIASGNHIIVKIDGKVVLDYVDAKKSFTRGRIALQKWGPPTRVAYKNIRIKELSGERLRGTDVKPPPPPPREVDLLKLVDPAKDAFSGNWSFDKESLVCEPSDEAGIEIPYEPPEEYDYRLVFVPTVVGDAMVQICRGGGRQFGFVIGGAGNTVAGFGRINGQRPCDNPTGRKADHWLVSGHQHVSVVKVRKDHIEGWLDGRQIVTWTTDWTDMNLNPDFHVRHTNVVGIMGFRTGLRVESATITEITGEGKNLRPPSAPSGPAPTPPREVDLLKLVEPAKDAVLGNWSFANGSLVCEPMHYARIEIPYEPPEEYDYRFVFVCDQCDWGTMPICRGGGKQFGFVVGGWGNTVAGFGLINGQKASDNPTTKKADHWLVAGQRHSCVVKVRKGSVEGWFDDKRVVDYKTNWTDISYPNTDSYETSTDLGLHDANSIGIMASDGIRVESATITEITGEGKKLHSLPVTIISARWGGGEHWVDVTGIVKELLTAGADIWATNEAMQSDPLIGYAKQLEITYTKDGQKKDIQVDEGQKVDSPDFRGAAPAKTTAGK